MKILIVPAIDWFTALENRVHHLARDWKKDHEIHVVHIPLGGEPLREMEGFAFHRLPTARTGSLLVYYMMNFLPQILQIIRIVRKEAIDMVVTTNLSAGTAAILAARICRIPSIFDYCDYLPAFSQYTGVSPFLQPLLGWIGEMLTVLNLRASAATVVIGQRLRRHAQHFSKDVLEIPNGVDGSRFAASDRWQPGECLVLGYVGVLEFFVDLSSVIESLESLGGSRLVIVGDGRQRPSLEGFCRAAGAEDRVEFVGKVPYDQIAGWISSMDICLLPFESSDLTESALPLKIHEYAACLRPIISSPLFEVVRMYGDLLTYATGEAELASRAGEILSNRGETSRRVRRAYLRATVTYSWRRFAARYEEAFLRAAELPPRAEEGQAKEAVG
jgi:glycosyltransferase involved in cell wall biosynthesis